MIYGMPPERDISVYRSRRPTQLKKRQVCGYMVESCHRRAVAMHKNGYTEMLMAYLEPDLMALIMPATMGFAQTIARRCVATHSLQLCR